MKLVELVPTGAEVSLPAGWKTQNPFRSTYFAAQAMAAEMSTGATALYLLERSSARVSMLVTGLTARFTRKATQLVTFTFSDGAAMREAIDRALATGEGVSFAARSIGRPSLLTLRWYSNVLARMTLSTRSLLVKLSFE